ncbi:MAG: VOC family protein [Anaerolineae bacterium]
MVTNVSTAIIYVHSQSKAERFWLENFDFKEKSRGDMGDGHLWIEVGPENGQTSIGLMERAYAQQQMPGQPLCSSDLLLRSDDPYADHDRLDKLGVKVTEVRDDFWGVWFNFYDQDGNQFMIVKTKPVA